MPFEKGVSGNPAGKPKGAANKTTNKIREAFQNLIEARGMGGSKEADNIENLMALCRTCHVAYGDIKEYKERLQATHNHHLAKRVI